jgi:hypothetical protein
VIAPETGAGARGRLGRFWARRAWFAGAVAAVLVFGIPYLTMAALSDDQPEVRVLATGGRLSALVIDDAARILILNAPDREEARAAPGRVARPWERRPTLIIAPADDAVAAGVWDVVQSTHPRSVVIAGIPGADPLWTTIEQTCAGRGIELRYVTGWATIATANLRLTVMAPEPEEPGAQLVVVRRSSTSVVIALDDAAPDVAGQVLVSSGPVPTGGVDLLISADGATVAGARAQLLVARRDVVRLVLDPARVRVQGGTLRIAPTMTAR